MKSVDLGDEYTHVYKFDSTFTATDGSGNETSTIGQHRFQWDASDANSNVDCYQDNQSPDIGVHPDSGSGSDTPDSVFSDIIEATASAASTTVGIAIDANEIISNIFNHIDDYNPGENARQWKWTYGNRNHQWKANHQLDPGFRHSLDSNPTWHIKSMAEEYGNKITFYGGNTSITDPELSATISEDTTTSNREGNNRKTVVARTSDLDAEDFHSLPSTTTMTSNERKRYGVREPTKAEEAYFEKRGEDIVSVVERFPLTLVAQNVTK